MKQTIKERIDKKWFECSEVWGPRYWFVFHSIARTYPYKPTNVSKKKYYEFIQNIPIFLPDTEIGDIFSELLEKYPVSSYLDSKESLMKWFHFIHNKINRYTNKDTISYDEAEFLYMKEYSDYLSKRNQVKIHYEKRYRILIYLLIFLILIITIYFFMKNN